MNTDIKLFERLKAYSLNLHLLSEGSGVAYSTVYNLFTGKKDIADAKSESLYKIAGYLGMSMDQLYQALSTDTTMNVLNQQQESKSEKYYFKVLYNSDKVDMKRVFPTKQLAVSRISQAFAGDKRLAYIMLFGSSVTMNCNKDSDIDLLVRLNKDYVNVETKNEISEKLQELCDWNADIIWYDRISPQERIYKNILKGVQIV